MDSVDDFNWSELIVYESLLSEVAPPPDLHCNPQPGSQNVSVPLEASLIGNASYESECPRKRPRSDACNSVASKACRERLRREKLNERFSELSAILEPGRPVKTDKLALLGDAIKVINQLKTESDEYRESKERLLEEIKIIKAEKNELRQEKNMLKTEKEMIELQLKTLSTPPHPHPPSTSHGFIPGLPPVYHTNASKVSVIPSYGFVPMWQYLPVGSGDTSKDHELRPPAA